MAPAIAVLAAIAAPAVAQDKEIGSRLKPRKDIAVARQGDSLKASRTLSTCLVNKRARVARLWLDETNPAALVSHKRRLVDQDVDCLAMLADVDTMNSRRVLVSDDLLRGFVAEAVLARTAFQAPAALPLETDYSSPWAEVSSRGAVVEEMGICLAATNPAGIIAMLATPVQTPAEGAAFQALAPSFGPCLSANARLTANRASMRAAMAEALYHRVYPVAAISPPALQK